MHTVNLGDITIGPKQPLTIISGPCQAESEALCLEIGQAVQEKCAALGFQYIFKASFDKANRTSIYSYRGVGLDEGLSILQQIKDELNVPILTDVHEPMQCAQVAEVCDVLQIPAFLCRQTDLLIAAAKTGKIINVKKGQFLAPWDMANVIKKIAD